MPGPFGAEGLKLNRDGSFLLDDVPFAVSHFGPGWVRTEQAALQMQKDQPSATGPAWDVRGSLSVDAASAPLAFREHIERDRDGSGFSIDYHAEHPTGLPTEGLFLAVMLPVEQNAGKSVKLDGEPFLLPAKFKQAPLFSKHVHSLEVPSAGGMIALKGDFWVSGQDERRWGGSTYQVRVQFAGKDIQRLTEANLRVALELHRYKSIPVAFADQANMGFSDNVAGDGKGGWTDQGPTNDLSSLPVGPLSLAGVGFDILDPVKNGGKTCMVFSGSDGAHFLGSAEIPITGQPSFAALYFLHAAASLPEGPVSVARVTVRYVDGTKKEFDITSGQDVGNWWAPGVLPNGVIGWSGANPSSPIGLYVSRFPIEKKPIKEIRLLGKSKAKWMVAAISGSVDDILFPINVSTIVGENANWKPYVYNLNIKPGSVFDFSSLNDAPAGKYGSMVASAEGHLEFENRRGIPIRLWGVNLCFTANYLEKQEADQLAERLCRSGYNAVRFHHFDGELAKKGGRSYEFDAAKLDQLDYLFAAMKRRGIYVCIDLFTTRGFTQDEIPDVGHPLTMQEFKDILPLSEHAWTSWKLFAQNLLTHVNPYTGQSWGGDPALSGICPVNEDPLLNLPASPAIRVLYEQAFEKWRGTQEAALAQKRPAATLRFLVEVQGKADERMRSYLRSLGVKAPITGVNYADTQMQSILRKRYDYVDNHLYWDHPEFPEKMWNIPFKFAQTNAICSSAATPRAMMPSRIFGKPYTVTEFNYTCPNAYRSAGGLLMSAYASLQDWDAIYNFDYAGSARDAIVGGRAGVFDIAIDPIGLLSDRFGAVLFRRGDIKSASRSVAFDVREENAFDVREGGPRRFPDCFSLLGLVTRIGVINGKLEGKTNADAVVVESPRVSDQALGKLVHMAGDDLSERLAKGGVIPASAITGESRYVSDTGQIDLRADDGTLKVVADRAEGFVLTPDKKFEGKIVSVKNGPQFGSVYVLSIDGKPLDQSNRILILHLTDCLNDKMEFADRTHRVVMDFGKLPHLVRRGSADISLRLNSSPKAPWKAWRVAADGTREEALPILGKGNAVNLRLETVHEKSVCLAYELCRDVPAKE